MAATVTARPQPGSAGQGDTPGTPGAPVRADEPRVRLAAWAAVAIWAGLLGILVALDAGFGNSTFVLEVSGSSAAFVLLLAGAVWLHRRLRPRREYLRYPTRIGGVFMLVVAVTLAWLSLAFGAWTMYVAFVPLVAAAGLEIAARRHARDAAAAGLASLGIPPAGSAAAPARDTAPGRQDGGRGAVPEPEPSARR